MVRPASYQQPNLLGEPKEVIRQEDWVAQKSVLIHAQRNRTTCKHSHHIEDSTKICERHANTCALNNTRTMHPHNADKIHREDGTATRGHQHVLRTAQKHRVFPTMLQGDSFAVEPQAFFGAQHLLRLCQADNAPIRQHIGFLTTTLSEFAATSAFTVYAAFTSCS